MVTHTRTYSPKAADLNPSWRVIDAEGRTLGRLATEIATILRGKDKPTFTRHMAVGDFVIVINASKIRVSGQKRNQKIYYHHTQYPGGLREVPYRVMSERFPDRVIRLAVRGMLPHNRLGRQLMRRMKIYPGPEHPHEAQVRAGQGKHTPAVAEAPTPAPTRRRQRASQPEEAAASATPSGQAARRRNDAPPAEPTEAPAAPESPTPTQDEAETPQATRPRRQRSRPQAAAEATRSEDALPPEAGGASEESPSSDDDGSAANTDSSPSTPAEPQDEPRPEPEAKD